MDSTTAEDSVMKSHAALEPKPLEGFLAVGGATAVC